VIVSVVAPGTEEQKIKNGMGHPVLPQNRIDVDVSVVGPSAECQFGEKVQDRQRMR
jgi:hypothetical protein